MATIYDEVYRRAHDDPEGFWAARAEDIHWEKRWDRVLDASRPPYYRWFAGGVLNTCYNALDLHVDRGRGKQTALIYDSPVTETVRAFTYFELRDEVARFAGALRRQGVEKGDRVIIYMPAVPEAVIAMLACARLGAIHSVVFGGFAPEGAGHPHRRREAEGDALRLLRHRGQPGDPLQAAPGPGHRDGLAQAVALRDPAAADGDRRRSCRAATWTGGRRSAAAGRSSACRWRRPIRSTSCTPRGPPAFPRAWCATTAATRSRSSGAWTRSTAWGPGRRSGPPPTSAGWWATPTSSTRRSSRAAPRSCTRASRWARPIPGAFWRVCAQHGVSALFTAPTAFRAIKKEDPQGAHIGKYDLSRFRTLFLAGERCDPDTLLWAREKLQVPVVDHWWQTETGWPMAANCVGLGMLPVKPGSPTKVVPGYDIRVLGEDNREMPAGQIGSIAVKLPMPPSSLPTLWNNDEGFERSYLTRHPGYYLTGDAGYKDEDDYIYIMSRVDDIINVAGHRLSTGAWRRCSPRIRTWRSAR